jgi:hypothetical protein
MRDFAAQLKPSSARSVWVGGSFSHLSLRVWRMDLVNALEMLGYFGFFWSFVLSRRRREAVLGRFRSAGPGTRCLMALEAIVSTAVGFILPLGLIWFAAT